jgi:hypothetical protein
MTLVLGKTALVNGAQRYFDIEFLKCPREQSDDFEKGSYWFCVVHQKPSMACGRPSS